MKKTLKFSIVASITGNLLDSRYCYDYTISDFIRDLDTALGKSEPTKPGNTEYSYLARENRAKGLKAAVIESLDGGNEKLAKWAFQRYAGDSDVWWATCSVYQNSGVLSAREFFNLLDSSAFHFEDCGTMGTLGGPLGGLVPDVAFGTESQHCIVSMRATPFWEDEQGEPQPITEATWDRLKKYYRNPYAITR